LTPSPVQPLDDLPASGIAADIRAPEPNRDMVDGRMPCAVVVPHDAAGVAAALAWASQRRLAVLIRGGGTKREWGRPPERLDLILDMSRLNRIVAHRHGDLTVSVEAGVRLGDLNGVLAARGQWLPLDPSFAAGATIGGLLATNDSGALRHRYGTPRDLVIGVELATADGQLAKAGGQVVKNVAGYDLSKVVSGSFGSLAAVVSATFKLLPVPQASASLVIRQLETGSVADVVRRLGDSGLEAIAFELHARRGPSGASTQCLLRFASVAAAVDTQVAEARAIIGSPADTDVVSGERERALWDYHARAAWSGPGAVVRASWLPAGVPDVLRVVEDLASDNDIEVVGRAAAGAGLMRLAGPLDRQVRAIERLRASQTIGNVAIVRGAVGLKARVDVWPPVPNAMLLASIKRQLDPHGTLGAGRGPL
jgi:glycolate oxidase FAD binding subunit